MEILGLIDSRNVALWNTLNQEYEIDIVKEERNAYRVFTKNRKATIYIPIDNIDPASFTHELLHIYMRKKNVFIGSELKRDVMDNNILSRFMSDKLAGHIGNCLEHKKMLPIFLKMDFNREDFISDYSKNKLTELDLNSIRKNFRTKILFQKERFNSTAIDLYIGKFFAVKACPNLTYNYDKVLNELKQIDKYLYTILDDFIQNWDQFDYEDSSSITGGYHDILSAFERGLTQWGLEKRIV